MCNNQKASKSTFLGVPIDVNYQKNKAEKKEKIWCLKELELPENAHFGACLC